jgi:hypothetical protein
MNPEAKLAALGLTLPNPPAAAGAYVPTVRTGNLLFCAGTIAVFNGQQTHIGQVGKEHTIETAKKAAEVCALNTLANIKAAVGSLDNVVRIVMERLRQRRGQFFRQPVGDQRRERAISRGIRRGRQTRACGSRG